MFSTVLTGTLKDLVGKNISNICPNEFTSNAENHCAHFVGHALGHTFGWTCRNQTGKGPQPGANLRVHETFARCPEVGRWADRPPIMMACLVFITKASNVNLATKTMSNVPRKHIGIYLFNTIYHYSNTRDKVVTQTPDEFSHHYSSPHNAMFYGSFPL